MISDSSGKEANVAAEQTIEGCLPESEKKSQGRVPKKIHKAEREKLKRDQLNELFLDLGHALEPDRQNNCKASILGDTTRMLRDLFSQVESLRKENTALLSESRYVAIERNDLKDENTALQAEISSLQSELQRRMRSDQIWSNNTDGTPILPRQSATVLPIQPQPVIISSIHVPPIRELQLFPESSAAEATTNPSPIATQLPSLVRRPHARYATSSDSWPGHLLSAHPRAAQEELCNNSISTNSSKDEGSDKSKS